MDIPWTRLPFTFDIRPLRAETLAIPEEAWIPHFNTADYAGQWSSVALRSKSGRADDIVPGAGDQFHDTPVLEKSPHLKAVVDTFAMPLKSVRLLRLHAGSRVKEHSDRDLGLVDGELRIHVPIITSERVEFVVANRRLPLREGESWFIDFSQPHRIHNAGAEHRVHLVIDGTVNDWAWNLLRQSCQDIATETFTPAGVQEFERFQKAVYSDASLRSELMAHRAAREMMEATVSAGKQGGYDFELEDVESIYRANRREWTLRTASL